MQVLFVGDINVDLILGDLKHPVQEDREVMAGTFVRTMGSSSVITAVAYSSLGGRSSVCGLSGDDDNGKYMLKSMDDLGIGRSLVTIDKKNSTGVTVNLIYKDIRSQITYPGTISVFKGPKLSKELSNYSHIHFSGIYQQSSFLPNIVKKIKYVKDLGVKVSLDTQWDAKEEWEYIEEIYPLLDYLFINDDEAFSISKTKSIKSAIEYFNGKVPCVIIKAGSDGAYLINGGTVDTIPPFPAIVVDTTGAGDAFAGGFFYALYNKNMEVTKAANYGSAVAARNCEFAGGVGAKSTDFDVRKKLKEGNNV